MSEKKRFELKGAPLSVVALLMAMLISAVIMALCGYNPFEAYGAIFVGAFGSLRGVAQTFTQVTPLVFTGLAFTFAKKANLINLGIEGQMYMGALGAAIIGAIDFGLPAIIHVPFAIVVGALFGSLYAGLVGVLKVKFGSNEVIATIMLNSIATLFVAWLLNGPLLAEGSSVAQTAKIQPAAQLPRVFPQYQLSIAIFIAFAACIFIKWFMDKTTIGYEIRCVGLNGRAAQTAGISINRVVIISFCISGCIAGLAGASHVLGVDRRLISGFSPGYGFEGIAVSALAAESPLGVIFAGIVFGFLRAGAMELNRSTNIPVEFVNVIQAMVVILVSAPILVREVLGQNRKKRLKLEKEAQ